MKLSNTWNVFFLLLFFSLPLAAQIPEVLPDDYLVFQFQRADKTFVGEAEHLDGFVLKFQIPEGLRLDTLDADALLAFIAQKGLSGTLRYPNDRRTPVTLHVVRHRGHREIYMKSSLGYFLWEYVDVGSERIAFAIYWWYRPPATEKDLEILALAKKMLALERHWERRDDRKCDQDKEDGVYSLFCALKVAAIKVMNEYNHHNTAMQMVRFAIEARFPEREFEHTLMDFNNDEKTSHTDLLQVIDAAAKKIKQELTGSQCRQ